MKHLLALLLTALCTYALRAGAVRMLADRPMPGHVRDVVRHASVAAMAMIAFSSMPTRGGAPTPAALIGALVAGVAARRTRHLALVVALGVGVGMAASSLGG